jgi:hypothetical protein
MNLCNIKVNEDITNEAFRIRIKQVSYLNKPGYCLGFALH